MELTTSLPQALRLNVLDFHWEDDFWMPGPVGGFSSYRPFTGLSWGVLSVDFDRLIKAAFR